MKIKFMLWAAILFNSILFAQNKVDPITTDRPDFTESPFTVYKGFFQIETGLEYLSQKYNAGFSSSEINSLSLFGTLARIGINDFIELRVGSEILSVKENYGALESKTSGINGLMIGGKIQFLSTEKSFADAAFLAEFTLPVGASGLRPEKTEPKFLIAAGHPVNEYLSMSYNLGSEYSSSEKLFSYFFSTSLGISISDNFGFFIESIFNFQKNAVPVNIVDSGMTFLASGNLQFDVYYGFETTKGSNSYYIGTGISFRLPQ